MPKYRKKPVVIEARQWFNLGDHPEVKQYNIAMQKLEDLPKSNGVFCSGCNKEFMHHGNVKTLEGWHIVCPGDWIIKGVKGEFYPCKPDIFAATYEKVEE